MGSQSTKPFRQRQSSTIFLRVPSGDWPGVSAGRQTEFRVMIGNAPKLWHVPLPTFAVCYRKRRAAGAYDSQLMVLESVRDEMLGGISDEGLRRAGYGGDRALAFPQFRRDWTIRSKRKFFPMRKVTVYRVRMPQRGDLDLVAQSIVEWLYGEFLNGPL